MIRIVWEVPPALWEQLLDECAPITRGRGILALRLIEELRILQLEASAFPSDAEREGFHKSASVQLLRSVLTPVDVSA